MDWRADFFIGKSAFPQVLAAVVYVAGMLAMLAFSGSPARPTSTVDTPNCVAPGDPISPDYMGCPGLSRRGMRDA